jgi:cytochrome c peroxidase
MNKVILFFSMAFLFVACIKEGADKKYTFYEDGDYKKISEHVKLPPKEFNYDLETPKYINNAFFAVQPVKSMATLGRVLFYDKNLSKDRKISCASCHDQKLAFADSKAFSEGANNKVTTRNSLALGSVLNFSLYYGNEIYGRVPFFWDNRATTVQEQSRMTLTNPNEMDMHMGQVVDRVKEYDFYIPLFKKAFTNPEFKSADINEQNVLDALSAFVNAIPVYNSRWDVELEKHFAVYKSTENIANVEFKGYTAEENLGKKIYLQQCATCHGASMGSPGETRANNGLAINYKDRGIVEISGDSKDNGLFKVPTLRNILLTKPYMHDGSLADIDAVLDHYSNNIKNHPNLSLKLKTNGSPKRMAFTVDEREALKAFFATLTDDKLMDDERFSDPFLK